MLDGIRERLGTAGGKPLKIVDVGAGFGGTSRVMVAALEQAGCAGSCGLAAANAQDEALDEMAGPGRRQFYTAVDGLFNLPADAPTGLVGVRIYATEA